jgi:acetyltransferase-like isoleucine patch superfamily enzyme
LFHRLLGPASLIDRFSQSGYRKVSTYLLRRSGVSIDGLPLWISPTTFWDISDPGSIHLGDRCVISHYVRLLTHDFSLDRVSERMGNDPSTEIKRVAPIRVGDYAFIGLGVTLLPGVEVGNGAVVGSGSVVTRSIPADEVWAGNPARRISSTADYWAKSNHLFLRQARRP